GVLHGCPSGFAAGVCAADATGRLRSAVAPRAPAMAAPNQGLSPMTLLLETTRALVSLADQAIAHVDTRIDARLRARLACAGVRIRRKMRGKRRPNFYAARGTMTLRR